MADDDPFADLGEALEDEPEGEEGGTAADAGSTDSTASGPVDGESGTRDEAAERDPATDPAFTYEDARQRPFYARESTIDDFDSWLNYELERELSERGYDNIVVREMTDALLRTAVEDDLVDAVAERFEAARDDAARESDE